MVIDHWVLQVRDPMGQQCHEEHISTIRETKVSKCLSRARSTLHKQWYLLQN